MKIRGSTLVIKFLATLYITRYLGLEALGLYGLVSTATIVVPIVIGMGYGHIITRYAVTAAQHDLVIEIKYYVLFLLVGYLVPITIFSLFGIVYDNLTLFLLVSGVIVFEHINSNIYQLLQNLSQPILANILHFIRNSLWVVLFITLSFYFVNLRTIEYLMAFWLLGSVVTFASFLWFARKWPWGGSKPDAPSLFTWIREQFKTSKPAYINGVMDTLAMNLDRYVITALLGLEMTGVYVFFTQIISALSNLLWTGVVQVARPKLVKAAKSDVGDFEKIYRNCLQRTIAGSALASAISIPCLIVLLPTLNRPMVNEYIGIYYILLVSFILMAIRETQKLRFYSNHRDDLTLKISKITFVCSLTVTSVFSYSSGLWGASFAKVIVVLCSIVAQKYYERRLS